LSKERGVIRVGHPRGGDPRISQPDYTLEGRTDHSASLLRNVTLFHTKKSNIVVFSQTIGQKNAIIFQNGPSQPHTDKKCLINKKVSQKWLKKYQKTFFCCFVITGARAFA
jgi:hypothetical protein